MTLTSAMHDESKIVSREGQAFELFASAIVDPAAFKKSI